MRSKILFVEILKIKKANYEGVAYFTVYALRKQQLEDRALNVRTILKWIVKDSITVAVGSWTSRALGLHWAIGL
jgi:hypothetical protein